MPALSSRSPSVARHALAGAGLGESAAAGAAEPGMPTPEQRLRQAGMRVTLQRVRIMEVLQQLAHADRGQTPETVHAALLDQGDSFSLSTLYGALNQLADAGLVERHALAGGPAIYLPAQAQPRTAYLVCLACSQVQGVHDEALRERLADAARQQGFEAPGGAVTLRGYCPACAASPLKPRPRRLLPPLLRS